MDPKRRYKYQGGNIDELAKPKLIKRESKGTIRKESIDKMGKSNNYKINKKLIPNNITINNNKQTKNAGYKFSETQHSAKRKTPIKDIKISQNKKNNNNRANSNSNSASNNNSYYNTNNKNDSYTNSNNKHKKVNSFFEENSKMRNNININNNNIKNIIKTSKNVKQKKFNNIDEAVSLIQKYFRIYLNKIHNTNSELMKMIHERKKNILKNYDMIDNQPIVYNNKDNKDNIENRDNTLDNYCENKNYGINNQYNDNYNDMQEPFNINKKRKQIKEDIIIDYNDNNNNYEEDIDVYKNDYDNINNDDKNTLENDAILNNNFNKKNINININVDNINNNEKEQNIGFGGGDASVFEKIYKNMKKNAEINNNNNIIEDNQKFDLDDDFIEKKDNVIDNQLDMIKTIQQRQIENMIDKTDKTDKINENSKIDNINNIENEEKELLYNNNNNLKEEVENDKNQKNDDNNNDNNLINENNIKENDEIKEIKEISKNNNSKNEVFQRLADYLDSTLQNPEPLIPKSEINKNIIQEIDSNINPSNIVTQNPNQNINNYMSSVQQHADNIALNLELKEAKKTIEAMSSVISDLKVQLKSKDEYLNKALLSQKNENDLLIQRQNTLMESLISEKRQMEAQINDLQSRLNESEKLNYKKLQTMRDNYESETKKNKDAWFQAEKIRRKKWEEQKIKEIKELTAKGLEPEIEKIMTNHKNEINTLEEKYLIEIKTQKEKLIEEYDYKYDELKKRLTKEKDEAIEGEKNLAMQRLRNQSERLEDEITEERRRWNAKLNSEIQRLESLREKDKKIYEDQITKLEERNNKNIFSNENFYQKKYDDLKIEYENKLKNEILNTKKDLEEKNNDIINKKKEELEKKFKEMKTELLKDRDKQINIVIEKLGEESLNERKKTAAEIEKKANEKNISLIEENNNLKNKINDMTNKLQAETKNRINMEQNIDILNKKIKTKDLNYDMQENKLKELQQNYDDVVNKLSGLTREFNQEKMNLELEMKTTLEKGDKELGMLRTKLENAQKIFDKEKKDIEDNHKKEIENLEQKIKKSFMRKDEIIRKLQEDVERKDLTIQKYEELLNQQRKELFGK